MPSRPTSNDLDLGYNFSDKVKIYIKRPGNYLNRVPLRRDPIDTPRVDVQRGRCGDAVGTLRALWGPCGEAHRPGSSMNIHHGLSPLQPGSGHRNGSGRVP